MLAGYGIFHGGLSTSSVFRRLCPWQGNKQAPREHRLRGVVVEGTVVELGVGFGWLQGEKKGMEGARKARGIGVKEMLTDTINVICLLPPEVDGSLLCPFVPPCFLLLLSVG